ncbi:acyl-CoA reductase [Flavobacteriaceae bacterium KMM 6897]|nr:acyl-CoA reductase [Flavobacteriaceae bacterium KMM 6897]MEB8345543.1 acyl-CoA reductase [Flavobacteriaceae bacterium KMM 6898]
MTELELRLEAFVKLGGLFREFCEFSKNSDHNQETANEWFLEFDETIVLAGHKNGWFIKENILFCLEKWGDVLTEENLIKWISKYNLDQNKPKTVALIMAGNIPLVGFHDFMVTILTGNRALIKLSSNDNVLLPFVIKYLAFLAPTLKNEMVVTEGKMEGFDAVVATGSDNTARYFEHYFGNKPNIIRRNRNSLAILTGNETVQEIQALGEDIFRYYGLGCRSVSKFYVPKNYNFDSFFEAIYSYNPIINQVKYANNYDYNKAVYLMSEYKLLDNGFLMLKEDKSYSSPIATVFYEFYDSLDTLKLKLEAEKEKIQCIVGKGILDGEIPYGETQNPSLSDYADGVDTVAFLINA